MEATDTTTQRAGATGNIKVTREDWLKLALETLISDGVESVRVQTLGQKLDVSRSSFYWYFKSRQDLLDQLLDYWRQTNTRFIVERAARPSATVIRGVMSIFECWVDEKLFDPQLDFAIRAWARRSPAIRRALDEADEERVDAIRDMFRRHGYDEEDAFVRARVLYFMQIGYYSLELDEPMSSRLPHVASYLRSFTGQEPTAQDVEDFSRYVEETLSRSR
ncbi:MULTISPECIES: TetR/AcrR family transcriptional regulator [unclassified Mesorhizobium]|uniref:TetR/AcrR family transcriptional regulator n=1 Tax=unclassified Mesorhizobium TaxID=325217 RepID=UPI0015E43EE8|nr:MULTISPECIES: TetR/AcrR family transcriptional regulator [unclassified Mesorhizobium]MBZ9896004.1 TetR/AcrR family transcriptional regulator [Mesorhizobium sp. BR1-1-6]MBZ9956678.1 TetR/AcrR family transcriptional regulator [Mesorhizobium sp. BR1-1-14]MBZ9982084.1 TetR/AcrR family transcriptional regulator [Mesorhizobium sp. BR-1-1-8]MCA0024851.1 TetR/AcrR family transcriptional regulator [Mesorhizobium sp. B263B1A]MCA0059315.1 TetR/AcrR family transcriptional regulator [Mesorhizobium sp. B